MDDGGSRECFQGPEKDGDNLHLGGLSFKLKKEKKGGSQMFTLKISTATK